MRGSLLLCGVLAAITLPGVLSAKGRTVKIAVAGGGLPAPVELTDPAVGQFNVWEGPGVSINGEPQTEGFIVNWRKGPVGERPEGRRVYELSFHAAFQGEAPRLVYIVRYDIDPATREGFVQLGGESIESHQLNTRSIYRRGLEGKRFRATKAWDDFIRMALAQAGELEAAR